MGWEGGYFLRSEIKKEGMLDLGVGACAIRPGAANVRSIAASLVPHC